MINNSLELTIMKLSEHLTDTALLAEIGVRLAQRRLALQRTQAELAEQAGIAKRTLERIETGGSAQMSSMIKLWRVLDLLPELDQFIAAGVPSPMELLQDSRSARKRTTRKRVGKRVDDSTIPKDQHWSWDDE